MGLSFDQEFKKIYFVGMYFSGKSWPALQKWKKITSIYELF